MSFTENIECIGHRISENCCINLVVLFIFYFLFYLFIYIYIYIYIFFFIIIIIIIIYIYFFFFWGGYIIKRDCTPLVITGWFTFPLRTNKRALYIDSFIVLLFIYLFMYLFTFFLGTPCTLCQGSYHHVIFH